MQKASAVRVIERLRVPIRALNPLHFAHAFQREVFCVLTLGAAAFYYVALASFSPFDPSFVAVSLPEYAVTNLAGKLGANLSGGAYYGLGLIAWLVPLPLLVSAFLVIKKSHTAFSRARYLGWAAAFVCLATWLDVKAPIFRVEGYDFPSGGSLGTSVSLPLFAALGKWGACIALATVAICAALLIMRRSLLAPLAEQWGKIKITWPFGRDAGANDGGEPRGARVAPSEEKVAPPPAADAWDDEDDRIDGKFAPFTAAPPAHEPVALAPSAPAGPEVFGREIFDAGDDEPDTPTPKKPQLSPYAPPPVSVFQGRDPKAAPAVNPAEIEATAQMLVKTFEDFSVQGKVIGYQPGPVVTVYEYQPEAGIKQSKVLSLIDDLALALKVDSIFIHPVQGKRALGVQVPNSKREPVFLGDVINTPAFREAKSPLTFAMGKTINGQPMCADLTTMPHLLVAGATGSGKSVCINTMLCSVIMKAKPHDVRMILVDPKMLELSVYEGIPHLLMPVITEPSKASMALKWAANEMEQRYKLMQHACVRNIEGFNAFWEKASEARKAEVCELAGFQHQGRLPYILLVIDELADLMMTAPKDVEASIQRLAQKARASGIHMVLATQRPSVDIITGVIKANLPCRVAFQVVSKHDSRTILDLIGAEKLLGKGDFLLQRPGVGRLERLQGALITDEEVLNLVAAIKVDGKTHYDQSIMSWIEDELARQESGKDSGGDDLGVAMDDDPKWDEALNIARTHGVVSASFLQRHLKIGYNRAARIVEFMESQGLVDKADGAKPRKWLGPMS